MKKLLIVFALAALTLGASAQATNPPTTFDSAVSVHNPLLWLNFNDPTTAFKDSVSGLSFNGNAPTGVPPNGNTYSGYFKQTAGNYLATVSTSTLTPPAVSVTGWFFAASLPSVNNVLVYLNTATIPFRVTSTGAVIASVQATGGTVTATTTATINPGFWYLLSYTYDSVTGLNIYINNTLSATTAPNGTGTAHTGIAYLGNWPNGSYWSGGMSDVRVYNAALTSTQINTLYTGVAIPSGLIAEWQLNDGTGSTGIDSSTGGHNMTWSGTAGGNNGYYESFAPFGTVLPQQPGFDSTNSENYSATLPYNGLSMAPNNTLGSSMEWNTPWTMMMQINKLNWDKSAIKYVLASKGNVSSSTFWELYIQQNAGNSYASQLCFARSGYAASLPVAQTWCTARYFDAVPNGLNYSIVVEDSGTGGWGSAISMWINGSAQSLLGTTANSNNFGSVTLAITSAGTGFTATTAFTSTGGGTNCTVTGTATESGGALNAINAQSSYGCTSAPTIVLTSPTGTGAVITATAYPWTMNSPTSPLLIGGSINNGAYFGSGGADTAQGALNVDEFAEFPGNLNFTAISQLFYETKFYQGIVNTATPKPVVIVDNDTTDDPDNQFLLQTAIGLHEAGLITLAGVVANDWSSGGAALWRQMLDSAGLNDVPVTVPTVSTGTYGYPSTLLAQYNASTPLLYTSYGTSTTMYRSIFAKYPRTPIKIMLGDSNWQAFAAFMQSPADGISSLTGLQMVAQDGSNGGGVYGQGGLYDTSANGQYIVQNNQSLPIIWIGGTPSSGGPGALSTRTGTDPLWIYFNNATSDVRQCYDCLTIAAAVSSVFNFGVGMTYSGGTGYANATNFVFSGGGANCQGSGIMTASGGVPNGIEFSWGASITGVISGVGSGCTSAPTVNLIGATGTGVTLTATPLGCGEYPVVGGVVQPFSGAACANQYNGFGSFNTNSSPVSGTVFTWFINSLVDPPPAGRPHS
jgi:hypothetical protein